MVALPKERMSVEAFLDWWDDQPGDQRYELVDGEIVAMGRDRVSHNQAKMRAVVALSEAIAKSGVDCQAFIDGIGVSCNDRNYRIPDAVVQGGAIEPDAYILTNPVIVVEVVSPSSAERDAHAKLHEYFSIPSIAHYLIVYMDRKHVVHHWRDRGGWIETKFLSEGKVKLDPPGIAVAIGDFLSEAAR